MHRDGAHIADAAVGAVIASFLAAHGQAADPPIPNFTKTPTFRPILTFMKPSGWDNL
jgi:hypothetical protein